MASSSLRTGVQGLLLQVAGSVWARGARAADCGASPGRTVKRYCSGRCRKMSVSVGQLKRETITCVLITVCKTRGIEN